MHAVITLVQLLNTDLNKRLGIPRKIAAWVKRRAERSRDCEVIWSHLTGGRDWPSSRRANIYSVARDKSRSAKCQRVSVSWFCEWPWSPRVFCDSPVHRALNPPVVIESSSKKLYRVNFSNSTSNLRTEWRSSVFCSSRRASSRAHTASPVSIRIFPSARFLCYD